MKNRRAFLKEAGSLAMLGPLAAVVWPHRRQPETDLRITLEPKISSVEYDGWGTQSPSEKDYYWAYGWFPLTVQVYPPMEPPMGAAEMMRLGQGCRDPLNGSEIRFALAPGMYHVIVTLYDSQQKDKHAALSVSFNGHDLGTFERGKSEGWLTWTTKISEGQFAAADVQVLRFVRIGDPLAIRQVRISSKAQPDEPPPPMGGLSRTGWNLYARRYMYAPTFQVTPMVGAASYSVTVRGEGGAIEGHQRTDQPSVNLMAMWERLLPEHRYQAQLEAFDAQGKMTGRTEAFDFYVVSPFSGGYRPARCGYIESGNKCAEYVIATLKAWETRQNDPAEGGVVQLLHRIGFPALMGAAYINLLVTYAQTNPLGDKAQRAMRIAKAIGLALIKTSTPGDWAYPNMPLSHTHKLYCYRDTSDIWPLQIPRTAMVGSAFLAIAAATGDPLFGEAAMRIADTLQRTQRQDGSWYWRVNPQTGQVLEDYTSDQVEQLVFLDQLIQDHGRKDLTATRDRAAEWMLANPVKTHRWEAQWDDVGACGPYLNLEWYDAGLFILYLLSHATPVNGYHGIALDLFHFIEDQFVLWENSYDPGFITPGVQEQYVCYATIDWHAAHFIRVCRALHESTGEGIYLQKARAMADTLTAIQHADGYYPTWMRQNPVKGRGLLGEVQYFDVWANCMSYTAATLIQLGRHLEVTSLAKGEARRGLVRVHPPWKGRAFPHSKRRSRTSLLADRIVIWIGLVPAPPILFTLSTKVTTWLLTFVGM